MRKCRTLTQSRQTIPPRRRVKKAYAELLSIICTLASFPAVAYGVTLGARGVRPAASLHEG